MTVQDIKDYIDEELSNKSTVIEDYHDTLIYIKYMLDKLELETFEKKYCNNCGSQRCKGVNSKWFNGCEYKKELIGSD